MSVERLATGFEWSEGPAWLADRGVLRWSDVVGDRVLELDPVSGDVAVVREPAEWTNGRTVASDGTVYACSHGLRAVVRETPDGSVEVVADRWAGGRFNSPNDIVVSSDGAIWFTDPPYGLHPSGREGRPGSPDYVGCFLFRIPPGGGTPEPVVTDRVHPNGLAFSPDEATLYVADTGVFGDDPDAHAIHAYRVDGANCEPLGPFADVAPGLADGFRVDAEGCVWTSAGEAVVRLSPTGAELARFPVPERVANVAFGGPDGTDLFITASTSVYRLRTASRDARSRT